MPGACSAGGVVGDDERIRERGISVFPPADIAHRRRGGESSRPAGMIIIIIQAAGA